MRGRVGWLGALMLAVVALTVSACGAQATGQSLRLAPTATAPQGPQRQVAVTPVASGWTAYTDPRYGFTLQYPPGATLGTLASQSSASNAQWRVANQSNPSDTATLFITATPQPTASICAQLANGTVTSVGQGIAARQFDTLSTASASGQPLEVSVIFADDGLFYIITLDGAGPASTFMTRWGSLWKDTLASFLPGHGPSSASPCA